MIEAGEVYSPVAGPNVTKMADELVSRMLLEVENESGERRVAGGVQGAAEKQPRGRKGAAEIKGPASQETAALIIEEHRRLWAKVSKKLECGLRKTKLEEGLARLKVVKLAGDILSVVVRGQRQAWGLETLESGLHADDTQEIIEEMASLTAPSRADTTVERE